MSDIGKDNSFVGIASGPTIQIVERDINMDDDNNSFFVAQPGKEIWLDYMSYNRYEKDMRRYMMGVASPNGFNGSTVAFVQLASPTLLWICEWTALKSDVQPEIPTSTAPDGWILLDEYHELPMCKVVADGNSPIYRVSGTYVYGKTSPDSVMVNDVSFPKPPWLKDGLSRNMPSSKLTTGLSTPSAGGGGSSPGPANEVPYPPPGYGPIK